MSRNGSALCLVVFLSLSLSAERSSGQREERVDSLFQQTRAFLAISESIWTSGQIRENLIPLIREAGFDLVLNLAPADEERNKTEGFRVVEAGLIYVHIPVSWEKPDLDDLDFFFKVMEANLDRKVYVHCFANMRVSVFVYLLRTLQLGVEEEKARQDLLRIWDPGEEPQWRAFIAQAQQKYGFKRSLKKPEN